MKILMELELADKPGQLIKVLEPIAKNDGNLSEIMHLGEKKVVRDKQEYVPLKIVFRVEKPENLEKIIKEIKATGASITKSKEVKKTVHLDLVLVGENIKAFHVDEITQKIAKENAQVTHFDYLIEGNNYSASLGLEIPAKNKQQVLEKIEDFFAKKNMLLIKPIM